MFKLDDGVEIVGEADNGMEALEKMAELQPNVVVTDISMPKMNGIELTRKIKEVYPLINVLVFSLMSPLNIVKYTHLK